MTNKQLLARIEELERRVRDLEARPVYVPYTPTPYYPYPGTTWGPVLGRPDTGRYNLWRDLHHNHGFSMSLSKQPLTP